MESIADFLDSSSKCVSLVEDDEDSFVEFVASVGVLHCLVNISELQEDIALAHLMNIIVLIKSDF